MTGTEQYREQADELAKLDRDELSVDLQSLLATYDAAVKAKDERKSVAFARAVVKRAGVDGVAAEPADKPATAKELQAEITRRNADREDEAKIKPASRKRDDLEAALAADDAAGASDDNGDSGDDEPS